jgi:hypothetical protein
MDNIELAYISEIIDLDPIQAIQFISSETFEKIFWETKGKVSCFSLDLSGTKATCIFTTDDGEIFVMNRGDYVIKCKDGKYIPLKYSELELIIRK